MPEADDTMDLAESLTEPITVVPPLRTDSIRTYPRTEQDESRDRDTLLVRALEDFGER